MAVNYLAQIEHQNECSAQTFYIFIDLFDHRMAMGILQYCTEGARALDLNLWWFEIAGDTCSYTDINDFV